MHIKTAEDIYNDAMSKLEGKSSKSTAASCNQDGSFDYDSITKELDKIAGSTLPPPTPKKEGAEKKASAEASGDNTQDQKHWMDKVAEKITPATEFKLSEKTTDGIRGLMDVIEKEAASWKGLLAAGAGGGALGAVGGAGLMRRHKRQEVIPEAQGQAFMVGKQLGAQLGAEHILRQLQRAQAAQQEGGA